MVKVNKHGGIHDEKGQFAGHIGAQPASGLPGAEPESTRANSTAQRAFSGGRVAARLNALNTGRHVRPRGIEQDYEAMSASKRIERFWDDTRAVGEYSASDEHQIPKIPDDYTPAKSAGRKSYGRSISGTRRTHRRTYDFGDVAVQMPSVSSVKRFSKENRNNTFDVPVSASYTRDDGSTGQVAGWVRVTPGPNGTYECSSRGFGERDDHKVQEAVAASLEARRPSKTRTEIGSIESRRQEAKRAQGGAVRPVASSWVEGAAYDTQTESMLVHCKPSKRTPEGAIRGYEGVSVQEYARFVTNKPLDGHQGGKAMHHYFDVKKSRLPEGSAKFCPSCGRAYLTSTPHECSAESNKPVRFKRGASSEEASAYQEKARAAAFNSLLSRGAGTGRK